MRQVECLNFNVFRKFERESTFFFEGEFVSKEGMEKHFQTRSFQLLVGAAGVLGDISKMKIIKVLEEGEGDLAKAKITGAK